MATISLSHPLSFSLISFLFLCLTHSLASITFHFSFSPPTPIFIFSYPKENVYLEYITLMLLLSLPVNILYWLLPYLIITDCWGLFTNFYICILPRQHRDQSSAELCDPIKGRSAASTLSSSLRASYAQLNWTEANS